MFRGSSTGRRNRRFFRETADITKKVNINPYVPRGGIRF